MVASNPPSACFKLDSRVAPGPHMTNQHPGSVLLVLLSITLKAAMQLKW